MVRDARKASESLLKKGFVKVQGAKHVLYKFEYDGIVTEIQTFMSRNDQDIGDHLIGQMGKQLRIGKKEFLGPIDCPLSEEDYIKILKGKDLLKE